MTEQNPHQVGEAKQSCNQKIAQEKQQTQIPASNPKLLSAVAHHIQSQMKEDSSKDACTTVFHKEKIPQITLLNYIERIKKFSSMDNSIFVVAMIYVERFLLAQKEIYITPHTVHKLIFTATVLAIKSYSDAYCTNTYYAKVGGVPKKELNELELQFLEIIDYNCVVSETYYEQREAELQKLTEKL